MTTYFKWRTLSKVMMWLYRRDWSWHLIPMLFGTMGFLAGASLAVVVWG